MVPDLTIRSPRFTFLNGTEATEPIDPTAESSELGTHARLMRSLPC